MSLVSLDRSERQSKVVARTMVVFADAVVQRRSVVTVRLVRHAAASLTQPKSGTVLSRIKWSHRASQASETWLALITR